MKASIRVWRGLKFNSAYAAKLAKKRAREAEKLAKQAADETRENMEKKNRSINPFSVRI
jgi:pre-rRNA-processing protein TSR4